MARTEDDKVTQAPLKLKLGDKDYDIKPLPIRKSREWRGHIERELGPMVAKIQPMEIGGRFVIAGLSRAVATFPEKICDLLFAYAPELDKEKILDEATEEQISIAFAQLWEIAFANFLPQMADVTAMLNPPASPASANSSN